MDKYCTVTYADGSTLDLSLDEYTDMIEVLDVYGNDLCDDPKAVTLADKLRDAM